MVELAVTCSSSNMSNAAPLYSQMMTKGNLFPSSGPELVQTWYNYRSEPGGEGYLTEGDIVCECHFHLSSCFANQGQNKDGTN